jgi:hypothetical protein
VLLVVLLLGLTTTVSACGGSNEEESSSGVTAEQAAAEIDEIKSLLDQALVQYRQGDKAAADTTVGDAYLEHFEQVEHPLEERDEELMEELEHRISTEIRAEMKDGTHADEVAVLVNETKTDLDIAKTKLQEPEGS